MFRLESLKLRQAETEGRWIQIRDDETGEPCRLRVACLTSDRYRSVLDSYTRELASQKLPPSPTEEDRRRIAEEIQREARIRAFSEAILLDWEGLSLDGSALPYSPETARKVLEDYPMLLTLVEAHARDRKAYLRDDEEEAESAGN